MPFITNLFKRFLEVELHACLCNDNILSLYQLACYHFQTSQTTLVKVNNHIFLTAHKGRISCLYVTNLITTFNTVDHDFLLLYVEYYCGVCNVTFQSFYVRGHLQLSLTVIICISIHVICYIFQSSLKHLYKCIMYLMICHTSVITLL